MEVWKDIKDYEELYQVSNFGTVKRIGGFLYAKNRILNIKGGIMKPSDNGKGYLRIKLSKNNISRKVLLHRIIAEAFISNPDNLPFINHKDGNKKNNSIENLEWCTHEENINHAWQNGLNENVRKAFSKTGKKTVRNICGKNAKNIRNTLTGKLYKSITDAALDSNLSRRTLGRKLNKTEWVTV